MTLYYVDTSAVLKMLRAEEHSDAFVRFYDDNSAATWVSSALLYVELLRTVNRYAPLLVADARELLTAFSLVAVNDEVVETAACEPDRMLRSLDAVHLATARLLGAELTAVLTYDDRLAAAATSAGLPVLTPS